MSEDTITIRKDKLTEIVSGFKKVAEKLEALSKGGTKD